MRFGRSFMDIREAWGFRIAFWWRGVGGQLSREEYDELDQALKAARDDFLRWERPETWIADHSEMDTLRSLLARTHDPERPPINRFNDLQVARAICRAIEQGSLIFVPTRKDVERYIEEERKRRRYTLPAGASPRLDTLAAAATSTQSATPVSTIQTSPLGAAQPFEYIPDAVSDATEEIAGIGSRSDMYACDIISAECKGSVLREFPGQYLNSTLSDIQSDAQDGVKDARKALKLLNDGRFKK